MIVGALKPDGAGPVSADGDDLGGIVRASGVQHRLQQRPGTGHQHNDPGRDRQTELMHG
jgi:hypothetical protein